MGLEGEFFRAKAQRRKGAKMGAWGCCLAGAASYPLILRETQYNLNRSLSPVQEARVVGKRWLHYEITAKLGQGGMGTVYKARDTHLDRFVALKTLNPESAADPDRIRRFMQEAKAASALNHPNIVTIHDVDTAGGVTFITMEFVDGKTLEQLIGSKGLSLSDTLRYGVQIADALSRAHAAGIVHRDLKPSNIIVDGEGRVKLLDFGLAKLTERPAGGEEASTETMQAVTEEGKVMGTAPYMSPEQISGKPVDRRTDVWAFGCVLYEALAGKRTFPGNTTTEILVGILDREPDWNALPANTPENVRCLLRRCLAKDPHGRLHDMADARLELEETLAGRVSGPIVATERRDSRRHLAAGVACGLLLGAMAAGSWAWATRKPPEPRRVARFDIDLPQGSRLNFAWGGLLTFSPDSKTLHYPINYPQPNTVYSRRLDGLESRTLDVAKGLGNILYSPDGKWMWSNDNARGAVVKLPAGGGASAQIAPMKMLFRGEWGPDGYIYWSDGLISAIIRTPADGGKTEPVTELDERRQERTHRFARLLPDAKAVMFTVAAGDIESFDDARVDIVDLASKKRKTLIHGGTSPRYAPSGHVVYARGGSLYAAPIDLRRLELTATPVKVLDGVLMSINTGFAYFDVSTAGDLAYAAGPVENGERRLYWVDRRGQESPIPMPARSYLNPRLSPDSKHLAIEIEGPNHDLYTYDFDRAVMSRITTDGISHGPIWSPDGKRFAFRSWKGGRMSLAWMPADRSGPDEGLLDYPAWHNAVSFSPDGKYLSFDQIDRGRFGIWMLPLTAERKPVPFVQAKSQAGAGKFSPDGKWVVYCSMDSGKAEVYVQPWPGPGPKIQISSDGGWDPLWRSDGKEIFYRNGSRMMAVAVSTGASFHAGKPQVLWEGGYTFGLSSSCGYKGTTATSYDVSRDGQRFLMIKDNDANTYSTKSVVVLNWVEELKRIVAEQSGKKI